jgi:hypothetical protein
VLAQGGALPDNWVYLDSCSTVTTFKSEEYLKGLKTLSNGIKINCNAGTVNTNQKGIYGKLNVLYLPDRIVNIFLMHELKKLYRITYNSWEGFYVMHTPRGQVKFHKNEQELPCINLDAFSQEAAIMLLQPMTGSSQKWGRGWLSYRQYMEITRGILKKKCSKQRRQEGPKPCLVIHAKKTTREW